MINAQAAEYAKRRNTELKEIIPKVGQRFWSWWTVMQVGTGEESFWFGRDVALPNGTILMMIWYPDGKEPQGPIIGPLFEIDRFQLRPLEG